MPYRFRGQVTSNLDGRTPAWAWEGKLSCVRVRHKLSLGSGNILLFVAAAAAVITVQTTALITFCPVGQVNDPWKSVDRTFSLLCTLSPWGVLELEQACGREGFWLRSFPIYRVFSPTAFCRFWCNRKGSFVEKKARQRALVDQIKQGIYSSSLKAWQWEMAFFLSQDDLTAYFSLLESRMMIVHTKVILPHQQAAPSTQHLWTFNITHHVVPTDLPATKCTQEAAGGSSSNWVSAV